MYENRINVYIAELLRELFGFERKDYKKVEIEAPFFASKYFCLNILLEREAEFFLSDDDIKEKGLEIVWVDYEPKGNKFSVKLERKNSHYYIYFYPEHKQELYEGWNRGWRKYGDALKFIRIRKRRMN